LKIENYGTTFCQRKALVVSPVGTPLSKLQGASTERLISIVERVIQILRHVHAEGIIHGDISPSNIMITEDDQVYLIDWGTALQKGTLLRIDGTPMTERPVQIEFCASGTLHNDPATEEDDWMSLAFSLHSMVNPILPWSLRLIADDITWYELFYLKSDYKPDLSEINPEIQKYLEHFLDKVKSKSPDLAPLKFTPHSFYSMKKMLMFSGLLIAILAILLAWILNFI